MKKAKIVVRENIIGIKGDIVLYALDGYYESPTIEFKDTLSNDEMLADLEKLYKMDYADMLVDSIELIIC